MKPIIFLLALIFVVSCAEEEKKIEIYNPEAFAFSLDSGWELNASAGLRNYTQREENDFYSVMVEYNINLITPTDTIENVDFGTIEDRNYEEILELAIDSQIELDTGFTAGDYKIIFFAEDMNNYSKDTATVSFKLSKEF